MTSTVLLTPATVSSDSAQQQVLGSAAMIQREV